MSAGIGGNKGSSDTTSSSVQNGTSAGQATPNNFPFLNFGWNAASNMIAPDASTRLVNAGINSATNAVDPATGLAATGANAGTNFANGAYVDNPANAALTPYTSGSYLTSNNSAFQQVVKNISDALQPAIDGDFAASGRYGSGANANAFASNLTKEVGDLSFQNFLQQQQNQLNAAQQVGNNYTAGRGQQLTATGLLPSLTSNLFTPGNNAITAGWTPLLNYIKAISASSGGGSQSGQFQQTGSGNSNTDTSQLGWGISAGTGGGGR